MIRTGDAIQLSIPDGRVIDTHDRGIEMLDYRGRPLQIAAPILLPPNLSKEDIPMGTEVFLVPGSERDGGRDA